MSILKSLDWQVRMFPKKWWQLLLLSSLVGVVALVALIALAGILIYPDLPSLDSLTDYRPKVPLRVYTEDGYLLGEFGEERRAVVRINEVPVALKQAILAAEDERFYQHGGVDTMGVLRAVLANLSAGGAKEGASTITMQVARNFFLSGEKTLKRKLSEALLAIKIEHYLTKDQILELYINQIYLGQRAYGFAAAAQVYYGKPLEKLSVADIAMLAGLPKAPSRYNPLVNPKRAEARQHYVLHRMHDLNFIDDKQYQAALDQPSRVRHSRQVREVEGDYVAEIVRQAMYDRYQDEIYRNGLKVYTTIRKANQEAANAAVLQGVMDYDKRHGYRGPEGMIKLGSDQGRLEEILDDALSDIDPTHGLWPAIILEASPQRIKAYRKDGGIIEIGGEGLAPAKKLLSEKDPAKQKMRKGALIRVVEADGKWALSQIPQVEAAFIGMDPKNGAVRALVGGFDFNHNKFNHVTQAWRQPGSSFKPFIYSASLEKGFTAASVIEDEPITLSAEETGSGQAWQPHNFDGKYDGPIRMRTALTKSKNMVSIRILQSIGVSYAQDYITRFGFAAKDHPAYLAMALGAGSVTPWQMAGAYSVFANGGYRVTPYMVDKIVDVNGKVIEQSKPPVAGADAPRVIDPRNAFIMTSMMQDVARIGTAAKARELGRNDLAGKTGTTNNQMDAWFAGFSPAQVGVAWIGYDQPRSLGGQETGGHAALPMWIRYMSQALQGVPDQPYVIPEGVSYLKVNPITGVHVADTESGMYEYFYNEYPPPVPEAASENTPAPESGAKAGEVLEPDQMY
jgi:penicillin-binding protein 1A